MAVVNPFKNDKATLKRERFNIFHFERMLELFGLFEKLEDFKFKSYQDFAVFFKLKNVCIVKSQGVIYGERKKTPLFSLGFLDSFSNGEKWRILFGLSAMFSYVEIRQVKMISFSFLSNEFEVLVPEDDVDRLLRGRFFVSHALCKDLVKTYKVFSALTDNNAFVLDKTKKLKSGEVEFLFFCFPYDLVVMSLECSTGRIAVESYESMLEKIKKRGYEEFYARMALNEVI